MVTILISFLKEIPELLVYMIDVMPPEGRKKVHSQKIQKIRTNVLKSLYKSDSV